MKWKAFTEGGLSALLSRVAQTRMVADKAQSAVTTLAGLTAESMEELKTELEGKQDKLTGAVTMEQVQAAIQEAVLDSWEASY